MAQTYVTDAEMKELLTASLQRVGFDTSTSSNWDTIIAQANRWACDQIRSSFTSRGYSRAQAARWVRRVEFSVSLALFWALTIGGVAQNYGDTFIKLLDRRDELRTASVELETLVVSVALNAGTNGTAYMATITSTGGTAPIVYSVSAGTLPTSLSLNANTGVISGTPTAAGTFTFTILATDDDGETGSQAYSITVT